MKSKILSLLSFARKSNNIAFGYMQVAQQIKKGKIELVILANDISQNSEKKIRKEADEHMIKVIKYSTKDELSHSIGQYNKSIFGIKNKNFAKRILAYYSEEKE
ncbi:MAG: ribosomal L7Ae/L30e/S12e/Gadd45 family protein [Clostridiales bacterium]|nr:ribosomal L7Ae/L30e/S12e/Gadd45 family protein [Clostridiales bacterium]